MSLSIEVRAAAVVRAFILMACLLALANAFHHISWFAFDQDYRGFGWKFDLAGDGNVPTWFASMTLAMCAVVLWYIASATARRRGPYVLHWRGLALIFLFLSIDETARIHEWSGNLVSVDAGGFFYYQWVVVGALFVGTVGLIYLRFLWDLPSRTRLWILTAALVYVGGALLMDMVAARYESSRGASTVTYQLITGFEESAEMAGVIIFLSALFKYAEPLVESASEPARERAMARAGRV